MEIITKRPKGISYDNYRVARKESKKRIAGYLKYGRLVYLASELFKRKIGIVETWNNKTYSPFVGSTKTLKPL